VGSAPRGSLRPRLQDRRAWRGADDPGTADPGASVDLLRALARLPTRKRACVVLRYYLDLSEADTAAALGVSVGTVKSQTAKALWRLQRLLAEPGPAPAPPPQRGQGGARWDTIRSQPASRSPRPRRLPA